MAVNGSGLALTVGADSFGGPGAVDVFDAKAPANTTQFLTRFALPAAPKDVAIGAASASSRTAPAVCRSSTTNRSIPKAQPRGPPIAFGHSANVTSTATGFQASKGRPSPSRRMSPDDVQVRNVELLVNGQVVSNSVSFPFDLTTELPSLASLNGQSTVKIQLRATDTGGNVGLSNVLTIDLVRDTTPPVLVSIDPANGTSLPLGSRVVRILFSKPLASNTVTADTFQLTDAGGHRLTQKNIQTRADDRFVQLTYDDLPAGSLQLTINAAAVTDRAGNPLGPGTLVSHFSLVRPSYLEYGDEDLVGFGYGAGVDPKAGATLKGLAPDQVTFASQRFLHNFPFSVGDYDYPGTDQISRRQQSDPAARRIFGVRRPLERASNVEPGLPHPDPPRAGDRHVHARPGRG